MLRLVALIAALLFIATPLATVVCEANCARHAGTSTMGGQHACCPQRSSDNGADVQRAVAGCDHAADVPASTTQPQLVAVALPLSIAHASPMWLVCARVRVGRFSPAPQDPLALSTQLRI